VSDILTAVEHFGIAGLALALWWLERQARLQLERDVQALHEKLDTCLADKTIQP
jgi:hypothetical protein